ncbi:MAG TPA: MBL fold metallo-hydrolase [Streptosporangiaceae bacterium]
MRLTVIGCSGSFPGPASPASCYLIEADGYKIVLDLGNGSLGALQRYTGIYDIDAVCVSHVHADHCLDLCPYGVARRYAPDGPKPLLPVYGPDGLADRMARAYDAEPEPGMREIFDFVTLEPGVREIGPFRVTTAGMNHVVPTLGYRIEHAGRTLAYSADTGPTDALVDLARGADLLLCEASFVDRPGLPADLHLTGAQAAGHAARAGVERLVLTHFVPWNNTDEVVAEARPHFGGVLDTARPGAVYHLA